jgi:hypothetical protein
LLQAKISRFATFDYWCDSRAASIGDQAFRESGADKCLSSLLNSPETSLLQT